MKAKGCKDSLVNCKLCSLEVTGSLVHSLLECPFINDVGAWLIGKLRVVQPNLTKSNLLKLNFEVGGEARNSLPAVWLTLKTLHLVWMSRSKKKALTIENTRARLEASVMVLRKSRHKALADIIQILI